MAIKSIHTNKASIQAVKTLLKAGDVLLDMGPIIDRKAPKARAGAYVEPAPAPSGAVVRVLQVLPALSITYSPLEVNAGVDDAATIVTRLTVDQEFESLDAMDAVWLGDEEGVAVAEVDPALVEEVGGESVNWGAPGVSMSAGVSASPTTSQAIDALIPLLGEGATRADVLSLLDGTYRPAFPEYDGLPGYLLACPYQNLDIDGTDAAGTAVPDGEGFIAISCPAAIILYTGT